MLIIKYFNKAYEEYLNGIEHNIFINKFIEKSINEINSNKIIYYSLSKCPFINSRELRFNNNIVGYFTVNLNGILTNDEENLYNLFLSYLTILIYNSTNNKINKNDSNIIKNILNSLDSNILITNDDFIIIYLNNCAESFLNNLNLNKTYLNLSIFNFLPHIKSLFINNHNKIMKNKKIKLNIMSKKIYITVNSFEYADSIYNLFKFDINLENIEQVELNDTNSIAFLSHELRNPLQTINLASSLLNNKSYDKSAKYIKMIQKSSDEMKKIINDILDLNKIKQNEMNLDITNINIKDFITEIFTEIEEKKKDNETTIDFNIARDVPLTLFTDILRLKQILVNLIGNSIKYSKKNQYNLIKLNIIYLNNFIYFELNDTGIGIKEEELNKIFECYGQTSDSIDRIDSNGLGLYISQKFANLLGGEIRINSVYGEGSTFTLSHPIRLGYTYNIKNIFNPIINLNKKILIVDDRENNAILLKTILQNMSIKYNCNIIIDICFNGEQGILLCKTNLYDIIFMDINMEGLDGYSTTKIIKNNGYNNLVVATTGDETVQLIKNNFLYFDDILIKPFDETNIINILSRYE